MVVKIGRQVNRPGNNNENIANDNAIWFKSKVVSRSHAEIWAKDGQVNIINFYILHKINKIQLKL